VVKPITFTPSELTSLLNLANELQNMLVRDYYYTFDLLQAGKYIDKLSSLLAKKQGKNLTSQQKQK
jgi:hypothetical protein